MKILSIAQVDMSTTEAGVVHVLDLASAMRDIGEDLDVVVLSEGRPVVEKEWLKVYTMPGWTGFWLIKGVVYNFVALWVMISSSRSYDAFYVRYSPNLALALWLFMSTKYIWLEINGISTDEEKHVLRHPGHFGRIYAGRFMERLAYNSADVCICVTPKIGDYVRDRFGVSGERIRIVPNGVDTDHYRPMDKSTCRKELGLEVDPIYVGFIGNFLAWQGIDTILSVLPSLMEKHPELKAVMVGHGERFDEYVALAKNLGIVDKVIFTGYVHKDKAPLWINSFDIGVVLKKPIISGYSPLKLYSYMACGVPVLATDTDGFEPVRDYNAGILVQYGDNNSLHHALARLILDKNLRLLYGENGRRCAEALFSWRAVAKKIVQ